jgi:RHS repeat-associated protein
MGFQSKYYDSETGLNYHYHRYYYPQVGRFINEDPIGLLGSLNMYSSVSNNPINYWDPFGEKKCPRDCDAEFWLCLLRKNIPFYESFDDLMSGQNIEADHAIGDVREGANAARDILEEKLEKHISRGNQLVGRMTHPNRSSIVRGIKKGISLIGKVTLILRVGLGASDYFECLSEKRDCEIWNIKNT